jgi:3-oxoacyl-(acyl-carrier-protein) synthase III
MTGFAVWGSGRALGPDRVDNYMLAARLGVDACWIAERTGIVERRWGGRTAALAIDAAGEAIRAAGIEARDLDQIIVATSSPDLQVPAVAALVADALDSTAGGFDINAACAGAVHAINAAAPLAAAGSVVLVVGADAYSRVIDQSDRDTSILFGDAAGALVLGPGTGEVLATDNRAVPGTSRELQIDLGSTLAMHGRSVYRIAVKEVPESIERAVSRAGIGIEDIALLVAHQANGRILAAVADRLGLRPERVPITIGETGNTSAATIPYTLSLKKDLIAAGDVVALCGFGAGMAIATTIWRWGTRAVERPR